MMTKIRTLLVVVFVSALACSAQQVDQSLFQDMKWRMIGPFRGGRSLTATGVPGHSHLYYFGAVGGGVWKSTDAGTSWQPIFDGQPVASIGALAVAPSDPNVIYVGTGEADMRSDISYGNGMYKSTDGGGTWTHIGLDDSQQIGRILVDPNDTKVVYVAALGHAYAANPERGVFKTVDGGRTWAHILNKGDDTGAIDLAFDPTDSRIIYAALWQTRRTPWNVYPPSNGPGSGLYKSTDAGKTWVELKNGLPVEGLGRIGIAVARTDHNRVYAIVDAKEGGLYRSDNGGQSWKLADNEQRIWGRGWYFGIVEVDPKNPDVVYVSNTSVYRSSDGGKSFVAFKGAPGGDDYHSIWIAPEDSDRMILSSDQGTIISLNGGKTWSSWYNQPTAQMYHVAADTRFPYWLYGAQQDSGAISVPSRGDFAFITHRDTKPVEVGGESGMLAPDPLDGNIVYGGTVERFDIRNTQTQDVSPTMGRPGPFRQTWTLPLVFSPADPHKLYFSHQVLFRSTNGGKSWDEISPDLTRENPGVPPNLDPITAKYGLASPRKGVIYAIAPSPLDANLVWVGTDDGLIHVTGDDGNTWQNVTPKDMTAWSKVGIIEASHFDKQVAYAAVDRHRLDDRHPYIYRTRDGGKTWHQLGRGIPDGAFVNAVREDAVRRGLLFAGTELGMYVSFNDGDDWQPLQLNLPVASVRDIAVKGGDLAIATHGRSFWILDDIAPLRELAGPIQYEDTHLFKPAVAIRIRPGSDQGTPNPPEVAHADNPPNGAIIDYFFRDDAKTPVVLEILDSKGEVVRRYSSDEKIAKVEEKSLNIPMYWIKPTKRLAATHGMHRFLWDLHYASPLAGPSREASGVWALPGMYTVRLTANGQTLQQPLEVTIDPRAKASSADLQAQFDASQNAVALLAEITKAISDATQVDKQLGTLQAKSHFAALQSFQQKFTAIVGPATPGYGRPVMPLDTDHSSLRHMNGTLRQLVSALQSADAAPTVEQQNALQQSSAAVQSAIAAWKQLVNYDLPRLNSELKANGDAIITIAKSNVKLDIELHENDDGK